MLPLYSDRPLKRFPLVTVMLIMANLVMFWVQYSGSEKLWQSAMVYGMIPADLFNPGTSEYPGRLPAWWTVFTSMFCHGGIFHLGGNMLYLWVFGRNVEDDFERFRFLALYLSAGVLSALAFAFAFPEGTRPLVGASGAVAGVLGVYFLRFPTSKIHSLVVFLVFARIVALPAFLLLGLWFAMQIAASMTSVSSAAAGTGHGGVAWIAHVAGFVVGIVWTIFELRRRYYLRFSKR